MTLTPPTSLKDRIESMRYTMKTQPWYAIIFLIGALFTQVVLAAQHTSITIDEPLHITSGYACLITGDYRLVEEHPPLLKMLQAAPLLLANPRLPDPRSVPGWEEGNLITATEHVVIPYRPIEPLAFAARVPTLLVAILLAAFAYRWAADAFGNRAGLLALALFAFDPNILAHAGVAATDLGAACAIFAALYMFWRWIRQTRGPSWSRAIAAAVTLGLALGVKSTVLTLAPIFVGFILFGRPARRPLRLYLIQAAAAMGIAFVVLWSLYRFEIGTLPGWPFPIPAASHLLPLLKLQAHMSEGHSAFLMGENYHHGVWSYFPIAFALKTPPLTLLLLLITALGSILRKLPTLGKRAEAALITFPLLYFTVSINSGINIGYRHLLPMLPFLFVWVSRCAPAIQHAHVRWRWGAAFALAGYAGVTLWLFPWHLAYFNVIAGGPDGGYRYLVDSNLDWGQTWKALRTYIDEQGITEFGLSQYTMNDPHAYDLDYTPLPPWPDAPPVLPQRFAPPPGVYAISTTQLQGVVIADPEMFDYFRHIEPETRIGHATHVYVIPSHFGGDWVAQCTTPVAPLEQEILAEGLGKQGLQYYTFDCSQSWLVPPGNGWYVLSRDYQGPALGYLKEGRLAYEQKRQSSVPPFSIYEWFQVDSLAKGLPPQKGYTAPAEWTLQQTLAANSPIAFPLQVGEHLTFLGYLPENFEVKAGAELTIQTYWQITADAPSSNLSLMAHLLGENGIPIAVGDGLGVPTGQWTAGALLIQSHRFTIPPDVPAGSYWLQFGAYTLPEMQRLPILQNDNPLGDRILASQVEIKAP